MDGGLHPAKRVVGDIVHVEADIFRDGHDLLRAVLLWRRKDEPDWTEEPLRLHENDRWRGEFVVTENARYLFTIEAWTDRFSSWAAGARKKLAAGVATPADIAEGALLIEEAREQAGAEARQSLDEYAAALRAAGRLPRVASAVIDDPELVSLVSRLSPRHDAVRYEEPLEIIADRPLARFSTWYELFPRSQSPERGKHGTFRDVERRLPELRDMGFDVLYLPPIHPIGETNRKGKNNALAAQPGDVGSPWAIGGGAGGHDAVEPALGTLEDFDRMLTVAKRLGIEIALDFALQCSPDHPWVKEHPDWFLRQPDGTLKYAENPPKKYQDVYALDFDTEDRDALWIEVRRVLMFWVKRGVRVFRVDNPHTKPIPMWSWVIGEVHEEHPEVLFLSEAFTRPKVMNALAKVGFTQSYTYFTWRTTKQDLIQYMTDLTRSEMRDFFRPNFWPNTPDILPEILQRGGRAAFKSRAVLAGTLSPSYGLYSGYELCESAALPGKEEYLDSEKYEIKQRDWNGPGIKDYIARLNRVRHQNRALQLFRNIHFIGADNENILAFVKGTYDESNVVIVVANLDPFAAHECTVHVPPAEIGLPPGSSYQVKDLLGGDTVYTWTEWNYVRLEPHEPAHILLVERRP